MRREICIGKLKLGKQVADHEDMVTHGSIWPFSKCSNLGSSLLTFPRFTNPMIRREYLRIIHKILLDLIFIKHQSSTVSSLTTFRLHSLNPASDLIQWVYSLNALFEERTRCIDMMKNTAFSN